MLRSFFRHGITEGGAVTEASLQIMAGADTTATTIRSTMLHVITNARVCATLLAEIDEARVSSGIISDAQAKNLSYLQAVIKEGSRIYPAASK